MKNFDVTLELGMDASQVKTYRVRANTPRKAIEMAEEKAKKDTFFTTLCSCEEVELAENKKEATSFR